MWTSWKYTVMACASSQTVQWCLVAPFDSDNTYQLFSVKKTPVFDRDIVTNYTGRQIAFSEQYQGAIFIAGDPDSIV